MISHIEFENREDICGKGYLEVFKENGKAIHEPRILKFVKSIECEKELKYVLSHEIVHDILIDLIDLETSRKLDDLHNWLNDKKKVDLSEYL